MPAAAPLNAVVVNSQQPAGEMSPFDAELIKILNKKYLTKLPTLGCGGQQGEVLSLGSFPSIKLDSYLESNPSYFSFLPPLR